ncbi:MAG: L,D-transpeptidase family protein [Proteobacteria bacterium]|nr:L,D-transpeptidase family protein [Pseudomonadota bacterium]
MKTRTGQILTSILAGALLAGGLLPAVRASTTEMTLADHVVVRKSERKLLLFHGDQLLGTYRIALGLNPLGPKQREKDSRTPEGRYFLSRRNTRSDYFLAIQVSYPNRQDVRNARRHGWAPGGAIMIHGQPNVPSRSPLYYAETDWTDGCIALSNSDMVEVWMRTQDDIPIEIYP